MSQTPIVYAPKPLPGGKTLPPIGLGSYANIDEAGMQAMKRLIKERVYTHVDTASYYKNEDQIGRVINELIEEKAITRDEVFVTTKVFMDEMHDIEAAMRRSLERLKLPYVDLYLLHWPLQMSGVFKEGAKVVRIPMHKLWADMERLVELGLTKHIGVSNFNFQLLHDLLSYAKVAPICNQIELHPYLAQERFVDWMNANGILPVAYSPLALGPGDGTKEVPLADPVVVKIAKDHGKTPAQIVLAWHLSRGHVPIPKSSKYERAIENAQSAQIKLSPEEVKAITQLNRNFRCIDNRNWGPEYADIPLWE